MGMAVAVVPWLRGSVAVAPLLQLRGCDSLAVAAGVPPWLRGSMAVAPCL